MDDLIRVEDLKTCFFTEDSVLPAVDGVSFSLKPGETLGIVGESGCGKSMTALSILRLVPTPGGRITGGRVMFQGESLLAKSEAEMQEIRGNKISMIFQEPMTSLNPVHTVGSQIAEVLELHQKMSKREAMLKAVEMLRLVRIPSPESRIREYPHQLSGGMRQRVMIAMALACNPRLLIADEPTTALDVTIQAQILDLVKGLRDQLGTAVILITHDLGIICDLADRVLVMYAGKVVEESDVPGLFRRPLHPYTEALLHSVPGVTGARERLRPVKGRVPDLTAMPSGCRFHPRCPRADETCRRTEPLLEEVEGGRKVACHHRRREEALISVPSEAAERSSDRITSLLEVRNLKKHFPLTGGLFNRITGWVQAVDGVSFSIRRGETLGLVGESGCGKTTTGRCLLRLHEPTGGEIEFEGRSVTAAGPQEMRRLRRRMQIIFQDPYASLNPRKTVAQIIGEPLGVHRLEIGPQRRARIRELLEVVGMGPKHMDRYPHEFSGGQRQRIGIARALAVKPDLIVCDEPVSALDVSIQAQVINLLEELQREFHLTYLFIAHDLGVVRHISDRVGVMYLGKLVELAQVDALYESPHHPYTKALMSAVPLTDPELQRRREPMFLAGEVPSPMNPPSGCRFHPRCPEAKGECRTGEPPLRDLGGGHLAACHF